MPAGTDAREPRLRRVSGIVASLATVSDAAGAAKPVDTAGSSSAAIEPAARGSPAGNPLVEPARLFKQAAHP